MERSSPCPDCVEDLLTIMAQARDNGTTVKVVGGSEPCSCLQYMNRLLGLSGGGARYEAIHTV